MSLPDYLLDLPAEEAARLIALALLDRAARGAASRVADPTDRWRLHDFRVATRRLRSCLQAYRPEIDGSLSRRLRRRLARLARATRRSRDLEVHLAWERAQDAGLTERQRAGLRWHLDRLEARRRRADRRLGRLIGRRFPGWSVAFAGGSRPIACGSSAIPPRRRHEAAAVLGAGIRKFGGDLDARLAAVRAAARRGRRPSRADRGEAAALPARAYPDARWTGSSR